MALSSSTSKWLTSMALGLVLLASSAHAAVYPIIQQVGPSALLTGQQADNSTGAYSESASLSGPVVITGVYWWGYYAEGSDLSTDNFVANGLNLTASGLLTRSLYGQISDGNGTVFDLYQYYVDLNNPAFSVHFAGGSGVGALVNDSLDVAWFWQGGTDDVDGARSYAIEGYRNQQPPTQIPEPGSLVLFGLALTGLALVRLTKLGASPR